MLNWCFNRLSHPEVQPKNVHTKELCVQLSSLIIGLYLVEKTQLICSTTERYCTEIALQLQSSAGLHVTHTAKTQKSQYFSVFFVKLAIILSAVPRRQGLQTHVLAARFLLRLFPVLIAVWKFPLPCQVKRRERSL